MTLGNCPQANCKSFLMDLCMCISTIAVIEIPTGNWPDFVSVMSNQAIQCDNPFFKMAGIANIGQVCEQLLPSDFTDQDNMLIWGTLL